MCDGAGDIEDLSTHPQNIVKKTLNRSVEKCKKCDEKPILLLQKKDPFCKSCFFEYCNHKFRSTIGKTKKVKHGDKVLLACSGGRKSMAMLHMTKQALDSASAKQISFTPGILFIDESVLSPFIIEKASHTTEIIQNLKEYGYTVIISYLEKVCKLNQDQEFYWILNNPNVTDLPPSDLEAQNFFRDCFKDLSLSEKYDLLKHLKLLLMTEIANHLSYDYIFVGDSGNSLAVDLLSDISLGRGSQISFDTSFHDSRFKVPVCRPIREFLNKELLFYCHLHNCSYFLNPDLLTKTEPTSCIQRLTEVFINDLQENFPATIFTIFRTGGKLSIDSSMLSNEICLICKSKLDNQAHDPCSAIEALEISRKLSSSKSSISEATQEFGNMDISLLLCHGCSLPFRNKALTKDNFIFSSIKNSTILDRNKEESLNKEFSAENTTSFS